MNDIDKAKQLKQHKQLATGLFLLMLALYIITTWLVHNRSILVLEGIRAFAEAAMVGALADWFAVTALFHHPLGLPIPHTNLIENSKKTIGDNLGNFVVSNFLTAANIRPYIEKINVSVFAGQWLEKNKNKQILIAEIARLLNDIVIKMDAQTISTFMAKKGTELLDEVKLNVVVSNALSYFIDKNEHEQLVTLLAGKIKNYIIENGTLVKEKVKEESYFFIPKFVDKALAEKITSGLANYFGEMEQDKNNRVRLEINQQLHKFIESLKTGDKWEKEFHDLKKGLLTEDKLTEYASALWQSLKNNLVQELSNNESSLLKYFAKTIDELTANLKTDVLLQQKINGWVRYNAYNYMLRNAEQVGTLISDTVGNWQGRELSQKLELEVGKDLQFIRINGTIVGGLVGLLIFLLTHLLA